MRAGCPPSTPGAGTRPPSGAACRIASLLLLIASWLPTAALAQQAESPLEPALVRSLQEIEAAFRTGDAERLRGVLPIESKVQVGLETFSQHKAFYAPEQVVLLFQKIFRDYAPVAFEIQRGSGSLSGDGAYFVPAYWTAEARDSIRSCRLRLMVRREGSGYYVLQIKETQGIR